MYFSSFPLRQTQRILEDQQFRMKKRMEEMQQQETERQRKVCHSGVRSGSLAVGRLNGRLIVRSVARRAALPRRCYSKMILLPC